MIGACFAKQRLSDFVPCPEADSHVSSLIRILAQRRNVQSEAITKLQDTTTEEDVLPKALLDIPTVKRIELERKAVQRELCVLPEIPQPQDPAERMKEDVERTGGIQKGQWPTIRMLNSTQRMTFVIGCKWRFYLKLQYLLQKLHCRGFRSDHPEEAFSRAGCWDHPGKATSPEKLSTEESEACGRLSRLTETEIIVPDDWYALMNWANFRFPPSRVSQRFFDRLYWLPYSHHHRYLTYEKVIRQQDSLSPNIARSSRLIAKVTKRVGELNGLDKSKFREDESIDVEEDASTSSSEEDDSSMRTEQLFLTNKKAAEVAAIQPSVEGDISACHAAIVRDLAPRVDDILRAENSYLNCDDPKDVLARMAEKAAQHLSKWSEKDEKGEEAALSLAQHTVDEQPLKYKSLESLYVLRYLRTRRHRLQTLHYLNAIVSLMLGLLEDEKEENDSIDGFVPKNQRYTKPVVQTTTPEQDEKDAEFSFNDGAPSERDEWIPHKEAGVAVIDCKRRWSFHEHALQKFREVEEELLSTATYFFEKKCHSLELDGKNDAVEKLDRLGILCDLWEMEATFCRARHNALQAYLGAYRHAADKGLHDIQSLKNDKASIYDSPLGARVALRREMIDLAFRRPVIDPEDDYFCGRFINATIALELEADVVARVAELVASQEREILSNCSSTLTAKSNQAAETFATSPGVSASLGFVPLFTMRRHSVADDPAFFPCIGSSICQFPRLVRQVVGQFTSIHQVQNSVDKHECRRLVLQCAAIELGVLEKEEEFRADAPLPKIPKDSKRSKSRTKDDDSQESDGRGDILSLSIVGDNAHIVGALMKESGATPKEAFEAVLVKENLLRKLYESEVLWMIYSVQCCALGYKVAAADIKGIDWDSIDGEGNSLREENIQQFEKECEPADISPPGESGPQIARNPGAMARSAAQERTWHKGSLRGVGRAWLLGGVWRSPPLALSEFSTSPAEIIDTHSATSVKNFLHRDKLEFRTLKSASKAQSLKVVSMEVVIKYNQIILDNAVRKMEVKRQLSLWRMAVYEGLSTGASHLPIGGPPPPQPCALPAAKSSKNPQDTKVGLTEKAVKELNAHRRNLVGACRGLYASLSTIILRERETCRHKFVARLKDFAKDKSALHMPEEQLDVIKLEVFESSVADRLALLATLQLKVSLVNSTRDIALSILGGSGGVGNDWGLLLQPSNTTKHSGPFFGGEDGAKKLKTLVEEYGPIWQPIDYERKEKEVFLDLEERAYAPTTMESVGFGFVKDTKQLSLETLWDIPSALGIVRIDCNGMSASSMECLRLSCAIIDSLSTYTRSWVLKASLRAPGGHLASGGDIDNVSAVERDFSPDDPDMAHPCYVGDRYQGIQLFKSVHKRHVAGLAPRFPGALMEKELCSLRSAMEHLTVQKGDRSLVSNTSTPQGKEVLRLLGRLRRVDMVKELAAIARSQDKSLLNDDGRSHTWFLKGNLLAEIFYAASTGADWGPLWMNILQLKDSERLSIHNELLSISILTDRILHDCRVNRVGHPLRALELEESIASSIWIHDRLRDALLWRSLLSKHPERYPWWPPLDVHFQRKTDPVKLSESLIPPQDVRQWMEDWYKSEVEVEANGIVQSTCKTPSKNDDHSCVDGGFWTEDSPASGSLESRQIEASIIVIKQMLDTQNLQNARRRMTGQVAHLTGFLTTSECDDDNDFEPTGRSSFSRDLVRKLLRHLKNLDVRKRAGEEMTDGDIQVKAEQVKNWVVNAVQLSSVESRSAIERASRTTEQDWRLVNQSMRRLENGVADSEKAKEQLGVKLMMSVDTQVLDKALLLLNQRNKAQRTSLRAIKDAETSMELAQAEAHNHFASKILELERELATSRTNLRLSKKTFQKGALESLIAVRRETLQKAFGEDYQRSELQKFISLEREMDELRSEVLDKDMAISKIQAWFKLRAKAFQSHCQKLVKEANDKVSELEREKWETQEYIDTSFNKVHRQLQATQDDLEARTADLKRSEQRLKHSHIRTTNLMKWKLRAAPAMELLKRQVAQSKDIEKLKTPGHSENLISKWQPGSGEGAKRSLKSLDRVRSFSQRTLSEQEQPDIARDCVEDDTTPDEWESPTIGVDLEELEMEQLRAENRRLRALLEGGEVE
ncbi:hypothetical protein BSKO_11634 [Bryopsis sp. KO-2023]|nr:hypothetical protein BSKO_11634 [Bryopsis sp. KO-2023]